MATAKSNTLIVIDDTTIATNIKPALLKDLELLSKESHKSVAWLLNQAIDKFMELQWGTLSKHPDNVWRGNTQPKAPMATARWV